MNYIERNPPEWIVKAATKDLSGYSTERLCAIFAVNLYRVITAVIWTIDDEQRPANEVHRSAIALLMAEPTRIKAAIARDSEELAMQVAAYVAALQIVSLEICRRADLGGLVVWQSVTTGDVGLAALLKALEVDSLNDYRDWDPRDLQQMAILGAGERYGREMKEIAAIMPTDLELSPIGTSSDLRGERWDFWRAAGRRLVQGMLIQLLPLVTPRFEHIRAAGRDAYRGEFERRTAKKRGGTGGRHAKAAGTEQEKAEELEYCDDDRDRIIDLETGAKREGRSPEDDALEDERNLNTEAQAKRAERMAQKRWGARGRAFIEALKRNATVAEASEVAGVSRQMGHKYLSKLKSALKTRE
jgi:hypothetical protein